MADIIIHDHGSVVMFRARSAAGILFMDALDAEGWQWLGEWLVVDHRPAQGLVDAIHADGLEVGG
jgi:hypothetical protein